MNLGRAAKPRINVTFVNCDTVDLEKLFPRDIKSIVIDEVQTGGKLRIKASMVEPGNNFVKDVTVDVDADEILVLSSNLPKSRPNEAEICQKFGWLFGDLKTPKYNSEIN